MPFHRETNHDKQIAYFRKMAQRFYLFEKFLDDFPILFSEGHQRTKIKRAFGLRIIENNLQSGMVYGTSKTYDDYAPKILIHIGEGCDEWDTEIGITIKRKRRHEGKAMHQM